MGGKDLTGKGTFGDNANVPDLDLGVGYTGGNIHLSKVIKSYNYYLCVLLYYLSPIEKESYLPLFAASCNGLYSRSACSATRLKEKVKLMLKATQRIP